MKKSKIKKIIILIIILIILCFPIVDTSKEDVMVSYKAILYSFERYRVLDRENGSYYTRDKFWFFHLIFKLERHIFYVDLLVRKYLVQ